MAVFSTTQAWVTRSEPELFLGEEKVENTRSDTYLGVTFTGSRFSLQEAATLAAFKRQHAHLQFQEPRTKLWLFDTFVTPTLLYGVETWGLSLNKANHWKDFERPLLSMIARMIRSKASVPHDIIRAEMGVPPIITKAFRSVTCIQRLWELPKRRYATG